MHGAHVLEYVAFKEELCFGWCSWRRVEVRQLFIWRSISAGRNIEEFT